MLSLEEGELDAEVFAARVQSGRAALDVGNPENAVEVVTAALALWRGPPLAEVGFEDFAQPEIRRLEELRLEALELRLEAGLQCGRALSLSVSLRRCSRSIPPGSASLAS